MSTARPTLKDIAQTMGVSTTTVHRALQGKGGVSRDTEAAIRQLAQQMGYQANYAAASLKRGNLRLGVALPEPSQEIQYHYRNLWQGARQFFQENQGISAEAVEIYYPLSPGAHGEMLQALCNGKYGHLDGLLTLAVDDPQSAQCIRQFSGKGLPVVLVGADLYRDDLLCCVKSMDELAGSLAAQLLCDFYPGELERTVILTGNPVGAFPMIDQSHNVLAFRAFFHKYAPRSQVLTAYHSDPNTARDQLRTHLLSHPDAYAIYSVSARHTIMACQLLDELCLAGKVKLVGNDRFPESMAFLQAGILTALIDKKVSQQSYRAAQLLFDHVVKGKVPFQKVLSIRPSILLGSNADGEDSSAVD